MSQWHATEEPSQSGDQIKIDFVGKIGGEEFDGGTATDFAVEIGSKSMIEGFEEGLIGFKKSEQTVFKFKIS